MKKALLSILCLLAVLLTAAAVTASAADVIDSGTCGEVTWTLDRDGTLTLSGSGSTKYYMEPGQWPWDPYHDQIRSVVVQDGVQIGRIFEDFGEREGYYPALTTVTINATDSFFDVVNAASFGFSPFRGCNNLQEINVTGSNSDYSSVDGVLYSKNQGSLLLFPAGKAEVKIPETVGAIHFYAFEDCQKLTSITIPDHVETIYGYAFNNCSSLTSVEIGTGLELLYNDPFRGADNITSVTVSEGNQSFSCIDNVIYSKDGTRMEFCPGTKTTVTLPASLTEAPSYALSSRLERLAIDPDNPNFTAADGLLYSKDGKKLICCPPGRTGTVIVPDIVTEINHSAFADRTGLTNIVLPEGLERLSWLGGCTSLESLTLPGSVKRISYYGLSRCDSLKDIYYKGTEEQWENLLEYVGDDKVTLEALTNANVWFVPGDAEKSPVLSAELTGGKTPVLTAKLFCDGEDPANACVAFYNGDGKQLGAEVMALPKNGGITESIPAPEGTASAKVFVLNADSAKPICAAVPAKVSAAK